MASSDEPVEQLLSSKAATPIAQLNPELPDQPTRKVHGEVTITWPYSAVSKSIAFLLAEPDFRLRRDKGSVRIHLSGPSAEAVGQWELGSGDEVTLALDGVEWAKDEEPVRPAGSRIEWQLKFAGRLVLKAILGETSETRSINVDQEIPVEVQPPEANEPIPFAEIDTTIFDDEPVVDRVPARVVPKELASPMFVKRSRASYGPLFELDLDDELEEDGGRKGKGRKRPRYSVHNRMWRYREDSSSPEPEVTQHSSPAAPEQTSDVEMEDTPAKPVMTDGGCQTEESDLAPPPSSLVNTPIKKWSVAGTSPSLGVGVSQPSDAARIDTGVQAFPPNAATLLSDDQHGTMGPGNAPNPFAPTSDTTGPPQTEVGAHPSFGTPQNNFAATNPEFGQSSVFGTPSNAPNNHSNLGFGQASSLFGSSTNGPSSQGFGQPSSLFGTGPAPTPSGFPQATTLGSGFGATGSSLRFGFGQEPQSGYGTSPFAPSQPLAQQADPSPYPESYLDHDATSDHAPPAPQHPFGAPFQDAEYHESVATMDTHGLPIGNMAEQEGSAWPMEQQNLDSSHPVGRLEATGDIRSDKSASESTPPGMIPPHVADGTRNADQMQQEGLLYSSVYRQGVPRNALPDGEDASVGEEDAMDSDDQAYDEAEKGDDYDLRNYDRVSDDGEGYDEQTPLPDDELLDEDEDLSEGEDGSFDEEDYDEEEDEEDYEEANRYSQPQQWPAHPPPQPQIRKEPVVIDLLSDSDDDEPPPAAVQATQSQVQQQQFSDPVEDESMGDASEQLGQDVQPLASPRPEEEGEEEEDGFRSQQDAEEGSDLDATGDFDEAEESLEQDEDSSIEGESDASQDDVEPDATGPSAEHIPAKNADVNSDTTNKVARVEDATSGSPEQAKEQTRNGSKVVMEEETRAETIAIEENRDMPSTDGAGDAMDLDEEHHDDLGGSFQTQPAEMLASFQTQTTAATDLASPQHHDTADEEMSDAIVHEEVKPETKESAQGSSPQNGAADESREVLQVSTFSEDIIELFDEDSEEDVERGTEETVKIDDSGTKQIVESGEQQDVPPSPPESQDPEVNVEPKVEVSMTTTITTHVETQASDRGQTSFETQDTELVFTQSTGDDADRMSVIRENDTEMVDAEPPGKVGSSPEQASGNEEPPSVAGDEGKIAVAEEPDPQQVEPEIDGPEIVPAPSSQMEEEPPQMEEGPPQVEEEPVQTKEEPSHMDEESSQTEEETSRKEEGPKGDDLAVEKRQTSVAQVDGSFDDEDEQLQSTSDVPEEAKSSPAATYDADASFATADSQTSEVPEADEVSMSSPAKPKRGARKTRTASGARSAKSATASKRAQRQGSQQLPIGQRATRSKTMSFQQATSAKDDQEDMSIKIARAALKSPSGKTKKKAATGTTKCNNTDLTKRLENDMPDCVPIKDLRKYNSRTLDIAAVVTSANTPPKRTATREYASSFTITDPSFAPSGVVQVDLYSLHRDHLPVVKVGDAVLLRAFTVVSLPGRGFGLKTDKNESSWAVFEAGGEDEPQMRAAPVEMNQQETKFLLDLRTWYAGLDEAAGQELAKAVGEIVEAGRESRAKK